MIEFTDTDTGASAPAQVPPAPYEPPRMTRLGTLNELTLGGGGGNTDGILTGGSISS